MLHHAIRGEGEHPVLLLHGFLGSGRNLGALARGWSRAEPRLRFVLVDLLGHGRSPPLPPQATLEDMADAVVELLDELRLERPVDMVGHSMGGRVALQARLRAPGRVGRVGLLDIRPGPIEQSDTERVVRILLEAPERTSTREAMRDRLEKAGLSRPLAEWLLMSGDVDHEGFGWRVDRAALDRFHREMRGHDLWPAVEAGGTTVSVRGAGSTYVRDEDEARFRAAGGITRTIEGAGHFLHVDRTRAVVDALIETLPIG